MGTKICFQEKHSSTFSLKRSTTILSWKVRKVKGLSIKTWVHWSVFQSGKKETGLSWQCLKRKKIVEKPPFLLSKLLVGGGYTLTTLFQEKVPNLSILHNAIYFNSVKMSKLLIQCYINILLNILIWLIC